MSSRSDRFEYSLATADDSAQILEIYESGSFSGNISVLYTRRPDPYHSLMREGQDVFIPIMKDKEEDKICAVGCCVVRKAYINGQVRNTGYLTGLKIHPKYQRRIPHIAHTYEYLYQQTKDQVEVYYTTILKENVIAQKMLEKRRKGMPLYCHIGDYTVYCFRTGMKQKSKGFIFEKGNLMGIDKFYDTHLKNFNFSPVSIDVHGLEEQETYTLRDVEGNIIAACNLWNQQSYKQYIITGYNGMYKYVKKFPLKILGYPNLPKENIPANYASITMLCVKDHNIDLATYFIKKVAESSGKYDFLMAGLYENHPLNSIFNRIRHIKYQSKLYTVDFNNQPLILDDRAINLEVGLL